MSADTPKPTPATPTQTHPSAFIDHDVNIFHTNFSNRVRRVSWGAILAGFFTAAALQLLFSLLGLAFGFWSIDPMTENNPLSGLGTSAGIWWVVTGLLSLAVGGCIAGYLCGLPDPLDGTIHGMVTWGLLTVVSFWLAGSAIGSIFNATANALGSGLQTAADWAVPDDNSRQVQVVVLRDGEPVQTFAGGQEFGQTQQNENQQASTINYERAASELRELLNETGKESLQPDQLEQAGQRLVDTAREAAVAAAKDPDSRERQFDRVLNAFFTEWQQVKGDLDQEAAVNVLTANTDMNEEEARQTIENWQNEYQEMSQQASQQIDETQQQVASAWQDTKQEVAQQFHETKKTALRTTEETLDSIAYAAFWSFLATILGLIAAAAGGAAGALPARNLVSPVRG